MPKRMYTLLERSLLLNMPDAVVAVNPDQKIQVFNPAAETLFGYRAEEVRDQPLEWLIPEASRTAHRRWVADFARDDGGPRPMGERGALLGRRADGTRFPVEITIFTLAEVGRTLLVALVHDLTHLRNVEARYREETDMLAQALRQSEDMVWITDPEGRIEYANRALAEAVDWSEEEIIGTQVGDLWRSGHHDRAFYQRLWTALRTGEPFQEVITNRNRQGQLVYWDETIAPIFDDSGEVIHYAATARDVTERFEREQQLHQLAYFDPLTGLANRRHFEERLAEALARAKRAEQRVGVLLLDLNRFKEVNDHLGHLVGDELLGWVGARLAGALRAGDLATRFGGDEFAVVLEPVADLAGCVAAARKVGEALNRTAQVRGHSIPVSASIGVALFPQIGEDPQTLISRADIALYEAKAAGEHYRVFSAAEPYRST